MGKGIIAIFFVIGFVVFSLIKFAATGIKSARDYVNAKPPSIAPKSEPPVSDFLTALGFEFNSPEDEEYVVRAQEFTVFENNAELAVQLIIIHYAGVVLATEKGINDGGEFPMVDFRRMARLVDLTTSMLEIIKQWKDDGRIGEEEWRMESSVIWTLTEPGPDACKLARRFNNIESAMFSGRIRWRQNILEFLQIDLEDYPLFYNQIAIRPHHNPERGGWSFDDTVHDDNNGVTPVSNTRSTNE